MRPHASQLTVGEHNLSSNHHQHVNACGLINMHSSNVHSSPPSRARFIFSLRLFQVELDLHKAGGLPYEPKFLLVWLSLWDGIVVYCCTIPTIPPPGVFALVHLFAGPAGRGRLRPRIGCTHSLSVWELSVVRFGENRHCGCLKGHLRQSLARRSRNQSELSNNDPQRSILRRKPSEPRLDSYVVNLKHFQRKKSIEAKYNSKSYQKGLRSLSFHCYCIILQRS